MQSTGWFVLSCILEVHGQLIVVVSHARNEDNKSRERFLFATKVQHLLHKRDIAMVLAHDIRVDKVVIGAEGYFLSRL